MGTISIKNPYIIWKFWVGSRSKKMTPKNRNGLHSRHNPKRFPMWPLLSKGLDECLFNLGKPSQFRKLSTLLERVPKTWLLRIMRIIIKEIATKRIMRKRFGMKSLIISLQLIFYWKFRNKHILRWNDIRCFRNK